MKRITHKVCSWCQLCEHCDANTVTRRRRIAFGDAIKMIRFCSDGCLISYQFAADGKPGYAYQAVR